MGQRLARFGAVGEGVLWGEMKPSPPPVVPGKSDAERFDNAVSKAFTVSKEEMQRREAEWQRTSGKKAQTKKG